MSDLKKMELWDRSNDEIIKEEQENPSVMKCPTCGKEANKNFIARCNDGKIIGFCWQCYHCGYNSWKEAEKYNSTSTYGGGQIGELMIRFSYDDNQIDNFKVWKE